MTENRKGLNPAQVQAPQTAHQATIKVPEKHSTTQTSYAIKLELAATHFLENGPAGTSSLSGLAGLHDLNFRNSVCDLRKLGIHILDERFPHQHSGGGLTHLKRYWLADRNQARKAAELVNLKRKARGAEPLSQEQIARYLAAFPKPDSNPPATSEQPQPAAYGHAP